MTWVIGATGFGYGVLVSDIRVTLEDGSTRDMLQKAYPVGPYLVAGFSGSVEIGFRLLGDLQRFLRLEEGEEGCWLPKWVAEHWQPRAAEVFASMPQTEPALSCSVLMVGAEPRDPAKSFFGSAPVLCIFRSPKFEPVVVDGIWQYHHIGQGSSVEEHKRTLQYYFSQEGFDLRAAYEKAGDGGLANMLEFSLGRKAMEKLDPSVSHHMHLFTVRVGEIRGGKNDTSRNDADGTVTHFRMPTVATSFTEFQRMLGQSPANSAVA